MRKRRKHLCLARETRAVSWRRVARGPPPLSCFLEYAAWNVSGGFPDLKLTEPDFLQRSRERRCDTRTALRTLAHSSKPCSPEGPLSRATRCTCGRQLMTAVRTGPEASVTTPSGPLSARSGWINVCSLPGSGCVVQQTHVLLSTLSPYLCNCWCRLVSLPSISMRVCRDLSLKASP